MNLYWACAASFLIGAIPTAFIAGKMKGVDIREHGSGNVGATNAGRVLGRPIGLMVYAIDFLKGYLPVILFARALNRPVTDFHIFACIGLTAVLGHIFTPFLGFKGGKGVATGGGALAASFPAVFLGGIAVWGLFFSFTRVVAIASIAASLSLPFYGLIFKLSKGIIFSLILTAVLGIWGHRSNIRRLLSNKS